MTGGGEGALLFTPGVNEREGKKKIERNETLPAVLTNK